MMYQGVDLSRFKKIASDGKISTLRHNKGHEIKIAHGALSPQMRQHIDAMPVHMAEGGDPQQVDAPEIPEAPDSSPVIATVDVNAQPPIPPPQTTAQELDNEARLYGDDLDRGHIKPETMSDLFGKKDTVGKIGTLFGLLVGGAGSGLTHQPSAILGMMQKEIDNDLEAQKQSNSNAQNWLKLSHEHEMQKANIRKMGVENEYTRAQTGKVPSEIGVNEASAKSHMADIPLKSAQAAEARMKLTLMKKLYDQALTMPEGPARQNYISTLDGVVKPAIVSDIAQKNQKLAGELETRAALRGDLLHQPPQDTTGAGVDFDKMTRLQNLGGLASSLGAAGVVPGAMGQAEIAQANSEAAEVASNRKIADMYAKTFNQLDNAAFAGSLNENMRKAAITSLAAQISRATTHTFHPGELEAQTEAMFPQATDWGKARDTKFKSAIDHFRVQEAATPTLDRFKLKTPFPEFERERSVKKKETVAAADTPKKEKKSIPDGTTGSYGGKPVIRKDGKWVPK